GRQPTYKPDWEDWSFHVIAPIGAYATLAASAVAAAYCPRGALFGVATAVLCLLFTSIHNAWDTVVYTVFFRRPEPDAESGPCAKKPSGPPRNGFSAAGWDGRQGDPGIGGAVARRRAGCGRCRLAAAPAVIPGTSAHMQCQSRECAGVWRRAAPTGDRSARPTLLVV